MDEGEMWLALLCAVSMSLVYLDLYPVSKSIYTLFTSIKSGIINRILS